MHPIRTKGLTQVFSHPDIEDKSRQDVAHQRDVLHEKGNLVRVLLAFLKVIMLPDRNQINFYHFFDRTICTNI